MKSEPKNSPRDFAAETIASYIIDNDLKPGKRLPSERDMCKKWELNRATLHSAIRRLVEEGVLTSRVGSGTFVASPRPVIKLQGATSFIESVGAMGYKPEARVIYSVITKADSHVANKLAVPVGTPIFSLCRTRLINEVPASVETTFVKADSCPGIETHDFAQESFYQVLRERYGIIPVHGSEHLSVTTVDDAEAEQLCVDEGEPAFYQSAVMTDMSGVPVEYFNSTVLPQRLNFSSSRHWSQERDEEDMPDA